VQGLLANAPFKDVLASIGFTCGAKMGQTVRHSMPLNAFNKGSNT
jgi:hypothetical protein